MSVRLSIRPVARICFQSPISPRPRSDLTHRWANSGFRHSTITARTPSVTGWKFGGFTSPGTAKSAPAVSQQNGLSRNARLSASTPATFGSAFRLS